MLLSLAVAAAPPVHRQAPLVAQAAHEHTCVSSFNNLFWNDEDAGGRPVLQRGQLVSIWGKSSCASGSTISIHLDGSQVANAQVGDDGRWLTKLPRQKASFDSTLALSSGRNASYDQEIKVAFGEVVLCSGQSNMEMKLVNEAKDEFDDPHGSEEAEDASPNYDGKIFLLPYTEEQAIRAHAPEPGVHGSRKAERLLWHDLTNVQDFSALCWYTGKELFGQLKAKVPVGLILAARGGSPIELWLPPHWVNQTNGHACGYDNPPCARKYLDSLLYDVFIAPLQPYTLGTLFWDQGESDVICTHVDRMSCLVNGLVNSWRSSEIGFDSDFVFLTVQLPGYLQAGDYSKFVPAVFRMRLEQEAPLSADPLAEAVPTYDLSCPFGVFPDQCPAGSVHNLNKHPIGARAGAQLLHLVHRRDSPSSKLVVDATMYPRVEGATLARAHRHHALDSHAPYNETYTVTLRFHGGSFPMRFEPTRNCDACCQSGVGDFDVVTAPTSGDRVPAEAEYTHDSQLVAALLAVNATGIPELQPDGVSVSFNVVVPTDRVPVYVRYTANQAFPQCALVDKFRLPTYPFEMQLTYDESHADTM